MTDILPPAGWPNVRQLETNEFASGGANGNMNEQAKSLVGQNMYSRLYAGLPFDPVFTAQVGGFPIGGKAALANGDIVRSTVANNIVDPNTDMTGWFLPYMRGSQNLAELTNKSVARTNLDVYSKAETNTAISNATTPTATETVAGKAKIATTAIAQAGTNDTDIITAKKLRDVLGSAIKPRSWSDVTASRIANTWYPNTTGNDIGVFVSRVGANISASITVRKTGTSTELTLAGTGVGNNLVVSATGFWEVPDGFDYKISPFNTVMELRV